MTRASGLSDTVLLYSALRILEEALNVKHEGNVVDIPQRLHELSLMVRERSS